MDVKKIIESLSPNEIKVIPYLEERQIKNICQKSNLDKTSVLRAMEYLANKKIITLSFEKKKAVELDINGALYIKKGLPERRLFKALVDNRVLSFEDAMKQGSLSEDELKVSIGILKRKNLINLKNKKIILDENNGELMQKSREEFFLENLPKNYNSLSNEELEVLDAFQRRKQIIRVRDIKVPQIKITDLGRKIMKLSLVEGNMIEEITPKILKDERLWKGKKFRRYDVVSQVPGIYGGKRHFVNQAADYAREIWTEMGFQEMTGNLIVNSFWNFDALFTAQDHPVREMQDTFFLPRKGELPEGKIISAVKNAHEKGVLGSKGWQYKWNSKEAEKLVLRTHTTSISSQTLAKLKKENLPAKFFALGKCFRNETLDWGHGFEFNQTEGIVIDKNANFRHLLGYLKQFFKKMGFDKIRFRPAYFPYTEPSVEIDVWHPKKKIWFELGGAGIFRPEVVVPLLGENIPVLAWGPGFDRIIMDNYKIEDLRDFYKNDINQLRKMEFWME